jgi:hypothetical protein
MSRTLPTFVIGLVLIGASAALVGAGFMSLTTDATAPRTNVNQEPVIVPAVPPAVAIPPMGTDAFTRPMFNRDRALGPDKAPPVTADNADPFSQNPADTPDAPGDMTAMTVKGVIISDRGARAALQAPGSGALAWVKAGDTVNGWKVESITASAVRIRNGDDVAELKVRDEQ